MAREIKKACVCGSGIMGGGIAARLANIGVETYMLDISPRELTEEQIAKGYTLDDQGIKNLITRKGLNEILNGKIMGIPLGFFSRKNAENITIGNYDDNAEEFMRDADWIVEVVAEIPKVKKIIFDMVEQYRKPGSIISSNTSGIPLSVMADGRSDEFKENFILTHFFNPVRFMRLLEITGCDGTSQKTIDDMAEFATNYLGKGVVYCKDTPGFVGNRIGLHDIMTLMSLAQKYGVQKLDTVFGKFLGRGAKPYVVADLVGLDTLAALADNLHENTNDERNEIFKVPEFLKFMVENNMLGNKTKAGFYRGKRGAEVLDVNTLEYNKRADIKIDSADKAKNAGSPEAAINIMFDAQDEGGEIFRESFIESVLYAANRIPEIAENALEIDKAMNYGFNNKGPFECTDMIGLEKVVKEIESRGKDVPILLKKAYRSKAKSFYSETKDGKKTVIDKKRGKHILIPVSDTNIKFEQFAKKGKLLAENKGARVFDIGKDVLGVETISKNGQVDDQVIEMIEQAMDMMKDYRGLVIGNHNEHFSLGADLVLLAGISKRGLGSKIEEVVKNFQYMNKAIKYSKKPIVVAKQGLCFGGGCEMGFGANIRAHCEVYTGLVEMGVGLIPGGGGTKEILLSMYNRFTGGGLGKVEPRKYIQAAFELITGIPGTVSKSAEDAIERGYLKSTDKITMNIDELLYDAREDVVRLSDGGYEPPKELKIELPGKDVRALLYLGANMFNEMGYMPTPYLQHICNKLAYVITGGSEGALGRMFSEDEMLKLERENFVELALMEGFRDMAAFQLKMKTKDLEEKGLELTKDMV